MRRDIDRRDLNLRAAGAARPVEGLLCCRRRTLVLAAEPQGQRLTYNGSA